MKRLIGFLMLLSLTLPVKGWSQTLSIAVKDKYLLGKGIVAYNKPVVQTDLFIPLTKGFYLDLWWSAGFNKNLNGGFDDELDYTVGWSGEMKNFTLDFGFAYFNLFNLDRVKGDVTQPYLDIGKVFKVGESNTLTPYFRTEVMIPVRWDGLGARAGAHLFLGIKHEWRALERLAVNQKFAFMYDTGTFVNFNSGFLGNYNIALNWKITEKVSVDLPTFRAVFPISHLNDGRRSNQVFGAGITFRF